MYQKNLALLLPTISNRLRKKANNSINFTWHDLVYIHR